MTRHDMPTPVHADYTFPIILWRYNAAMDAEDEIWDYLDIEAEADISTEEGGQPDETLRYMDGPRCTLLLERTKRRLQSMEEEGWEFEVAIGTRKAHSVERLESVIEDLLWGEV